MERKHNPALAALRKACSKGEPIIEQPTQTALDARKAFVIRYALYRPCPEHDGLSSPQSRGMVLAFAAQGSNTYATREEAEQYRAAVLGNNSRDTLRSVWKCEPEACIVLPVDCWPGHFDPKGIYTDAPL